LFDNYPTRTITIKKTEDPLKGHSAFDNSTWLPSGRNLHFYADPINNFRVVQPLIV